MWQQHTLKEENQWQKVEMAAGSIPTAGPGRVPGALSALGRAQNPHVTKDLANLQAETFTQDLSCRPGEKMGQGRLLKWKFFIYDMIELLIY